MALFLGDKRVERNHVNLFYDLFHVYLETFNDMQFRKSLDCSLDTSEGELLLLGEIARYPEGVRKDDLVEKLKVTEREIEIRASKLLERGMITNQTHAGRRARRPFIISHKRSVSISPTTV